MKHVFKIVALLVMVTVGVSAVQAQLLTVQDQPRQSPGGCHEHPGKAPAPSPASYQCCLTGHNAAIPQSSHASEPFHFTHTELVSEPPTNGFAPAVRTGISIPAASPPGGTPLRI